MSGLNGNGYWLKRFILGMAAMLGTAFLLIDHIHQTKAESMELEAVRKQITQVRAEYLDRLDEIKGLMMCLHYPGLPGCGKVLDQARKDEGHPPIDGHH